MNAEGPNRKKATEKLEEPFRDDEGTSGGKEENRKICDASCDNDEKKRTSVDITDANPKPYAQATAAPTAAAHWSPAALENSRARKSGASGGPPWRHTHKRPKT